MTITLTKEGKFKCDCGEIHDCLDYFEFYGTMMTCPACRERYDMEWNEEYGMYVVIPK